MYADHDSGNKWLKYKIFQNAIQLKSKNKRKKKDASTKKGRFIGYPCVKTALKKYS